MKEDLVLASAKESRWLFDRTDVTNPYRDDAYAFSEYCTGDLHAGSAVVTYAANGKSATIHHVGGDNLRAYVSRLVATFPDVPRVTIAGVSAGGFGATLNYCLVHDAFCNARVDALNDSAMPIEAADSDFPKRVATWNVALPPGCAACGERLSAWLPFYASRITAPHRHALFSFLGDAMVAAAPGLDGAALETQILALRAATGPNQKTFFLAGTRHGVLTPVGSSLTASDGSRVQPWLSTFASDDPSWDHAGP